MLLALGVKSPSHLHVAVERYAEALRGALQDGDAAAALHAELAAPPGSWPAVAAAMGASLGQVAMLQVRTNAVGGHSSILQNKYELQGSDKEQVQ